MQDATASAPSEAPAALIGRPVWRMWPGQAWQRAEVGAWDARSGHHRLVFSTSPSEMHDFMASMQPNAHANAHVEPAVQLTWSDPAINMPPHVHPPSSLVFQPLLPASPLPSSSPPVPQQPRTPVQYLRCAAFALSVKPHSNSSASGGRRQPATPAVIENVTVDDSRLSQIEGENGAGEATVVPRADSAQLEGTMPLPIAASQPEPPLQDSAHSTGSHAFVFLKHASNRCKHAYMELHIRGLTCPASETVRLFTRICTAATQKGGLLTLTSIVSSGLCPSPSCADHTNHIGGTAALAHGQSASGYHVMRVTHARLCSVYTYGCATNGSRCSQLPSQQWSRCYQWGRRGGGGYRCGACGN